MKEKKLRIEDALAATRAAVEEGIVPGGGVALLTAIPSIKKLVKSLSGDEKTGAEIVLKALEEPVRQIALNAGIDGSIIVNNILNSKKSSCYGYDALKNEYGRHGRTRNNRSYQSHAFRASERRIGCFHPAYHRERGCRYSRTRARSSCRRNGRRNGRNVLIVIQPKTLIYNEKNRDGKNRCGFCFDFFNVVILSLKRLSVAAVVLQELMKRP